MRLFLCLASALSGLSLFSLSGATPVGPESTWAQGATLIVTNTADAGAGSLRDAIAAANDGDIIRFDATLNGQAITLTGGELAIDKGITISGPGPNLLTVARSSAAPHFRIFDVMPGHDVLIEGLTISGGHAEAAIGGGIFSDHAILTVNNCVVSGNFSDAAAGGGGIYNRVGTLAVTNSTVSSNRAGSMTGDPLGLGGGIVSGGTLTIISSTITGNTADVSGGGILASGTMTVTDSTVSGNRAGLGTLQDSGFGGGIYNNGTAEIRNSTISGNTASGNGSGNGGGIHNNGSSAMLTITNSTLSGNSANQNGGGIYNFNEGTIEIGNTILMAGASGTNIFSGSGAVTSRGYNLSSDNAGGFLNGSGDLININPMLGPLQNNGGPTSTHEPLPGSPAINAGDPNFTPPPLFDQRGPGYDRVFNGRIDIGSLEVQPPPTPTPTPAPTTAPTATPAATPTPTPGATQTPAPTASPTPAPAQALNISTRLRVETGERVMIGGFIITGAVPKNVAVRGIGPSLAGAGISDPLADPTLELRDSSGALLVENDNWQDDLAQAAQLTALGLAPTDPRESGIVAPLQPGAYTAIVAGKDQTTGIGLMELYDADLAAVSQLANISTRGFVQTGDNVMIGGFILGHNNASTGIIVRGIGPSLSQAGVNNVLADPTLELRDSNGALLTANDNWQDDPISAAQLTTHGLAPQDPLESGIFATLSPGAFTAILAGRIGGTGIGLVEIYNVR